MPLRNTAGLVAGLTYGLVLTLACPAAGADPGPSAQDVADAREDAQDRAQELGKAQADLAVARARQQDLTADVERLVEDYNGELVKLDQARTDYEAAVARLDQAGAMVEDARKTVSAMVAQDYAEPDPNEQAFALVAGSTGLTGFLRRASVFTQLQSERTATLQHLKDTQQVYAILGGQAKRILAEQMETAGRVKLARDAAQQAVDRQLAETEELKQEEAAIETRLEAAQSKVERLQREREEARLRRMNRRSGMKIPQWAAGRGQGQGGIAARWALNQLGKPYVWAAAGPSSYDCSGLTMKAWGRAGVDLDHWTGTQWSSGPHVPLSRLSRGDLLFYGRVTRNPGTIHHVGIYIGHGMMVHAPQTGDVVRIASIWRHDLVGATRPR